MSDSEIVVNDSGRPGYEVAAKIDAGYHVKFDSNGKLVKNDDTAETAVGYTWSDADPNGDRNIDKLTTVLPPRKGTVANVVVNIADGDEASGNVAVGDVLYYRSDGTLAKEADGATNGSSRTVTTEPAAIALEAVSTDDDSLHRVYLIGGA